MVDDFKSLRDGLFRTLLGSLDEDDDESATGSKSRLDASATKALLGQIFARAGKGKDEVVQIIAREIGVAVAAMLKEPLAQLAKNQKLQISFEFVPKSGKGDAAGALPRKGRKPAARARRQRSMDKGPRVR